jgi:hypothetical protein
MRQNDRLGHALALGILPLDWINRQQECFLKLQEHLDNLVWAWDQAVSMAGRWPGAEAIARRLEKRINYFAPKVYPNITHPSDPARLLDLTPAVLHEAWALRRNCPLKWQDYKIHNLRFHGLEYWVPDYEKNQSAANHLYDYYQNSYINHYSAHRSDAAEQIVLIERGDALPGGHFQDDRADLLDWVSDAELEFYEALQDQLLDAYQRKGLIIEVNPSSNVYIGRIDDYHQHPIFRWNPPKDEWLEPGKRCNRFGLRRGAMSVCVNTDDMGIFPTNLPNEFQLLLEAAQETHGVGRLEASRWLDEIRQFAVEQFDMTHANL